MSQPPPIRATSAAAASVSHDTAAAADSSPSAATAAASSGSPPPSARSVIIIGAGLAGLTVAAELVRSSAASASASAPLPLHITILEARDRIGGRLLSIPHEAAAAASAAGLSASAVVPPVPSSSSSLDLGGTWHWPHHSSLASLVRALGLSSFRGADSARMGGAARVRGGSQGLAAALWEQIQRAAPAGHTVDLKLGAVCSDIEIAATERGQEAKVTTAAGEAFSARTAVVVAVPPRLALHSFSFRPALSAASVRHLRSVPTWMASSCKVALRFEEPFWLTRGLPDEQESAQDDPVFEWHDASSDRNEAGKSGAGGSVSGSKHAATHALIGFARPGCTASSVSAQLRRCYSSSGFTPPASVSFHVTDWSRERFTSATERDSAGGHPHAHPDVRGSLWSDQSGASALSPAPLLLFASSELAESEAGYMEGAVLRGQQVAEQVRGSKQWAADSHNK